MNVTATINENKLIKMHSAWAAKPGDGFMHFCFQPPWYQTTNVITAPDPAQQVEAAESKEPKSACQPIDPGPLILDIQVYSNAKDLIYSIVFNIT